MKNQRRKGAWLVASAGTIHISTGKTTNGVVINEGEMLNLVENKYNLGDGDKVKKVLIRGTMPRNFIAGEKVEIYGKYKPLCGLYNWEIVGRMRWSTDRDLIRQWVGKNTCKLMYFD